MINMTDFTMSNIQRLIESKQLSKDDLISLFTIEDLIHNARYQNFSPFGTFQKLADTVDEFLQNNGYCFEKKSITYNVNQVYYAPTSFFKLKLSEQLDVVNEFSLKEIKYILSRKIVIQKFALMINQNYNDTSFLQKISPAFLTYLLMSFRTEDNYLSKDLEKELLANILLCYGKANKDDIWVKVLNYRLLSLTKSTSLADEHIVFNKNKTLRVALIISGQLRSGFENVISKFASKFKHFDCDAYISTWENVGFSRLDKINIARILTQEALEYISKNMNSVNFDQLNSKIRENIDKVFSPSIINNKLLDTLGWCNNIHINLLNEKDKPYMAMFNAEKMYYHNFYILNKYGEEHFSNYDLIIKLRPDMDFINCDPIKLDYENMIKFNYVIAENGYMFREWGFGMGDQLWIGCPSNIMLLLGSYNPSNLSYILNDKRYQGHANCGFEAWLNGLRLDRVTDSSMGYRLTDGLEITLEELLLMIS